MRKPWSILRRGFPILEWSRGYSMDVAFQDMVAGLTVGLTLIPQCIAYASLAGLEPQYGLYSSLCGGFIYALFGTIPELNIAPTALLSLITYSYTHNATFGNVNAAILLTFMAGIVELLCGFLHLGFLVDFVSTPVVAAFTSAGAITIASSQVKNLFGLKFTAETFIDVWKNVFTHITELRFWDTILGVSCCVLLIAMRKLKDYGEAPLGNSGKPREKSSIFKKIVWFTSVARNALVVVGCAVIAFVCHHYNKTPFSLTSKVPSGFPNVSLPAFTVESHNKTIHFPQMVSELGYGILVVPLIAILANVGIAKAFAHGKVVDASQEMVAVGLCNLVGSFFGSYPVNASFSRSAVGSASGIKTPLAGVYTGALVIMAFSFLTQYFSFIPKPTLSAVIICAVLFMVEVTITKLIWNINKLDLIPFFVTLVACLIIGIELGILIGVIVEVLKLLYYSSRPKVLVEKVTMSFNKHYLKVTLTTSLFFASAEFVRDKVLQFSNDLGHNCQSVAIDCSRINNLDYTAGKCIGDMVADLRKHGKMVVCLSPKESIANVLTSVCKPDIAIYETEADFQNSLTGKYGSLNNGGNPLEIVLTTPL